MIATARAAVDAWGGSVVGSPREVHADGLRADPEAAAHGWPASGEDLLPMLASAGPELAAAGLVAVVTDRRPGEPVVWVSIRDRGHDWRTGHTPLQLAPPLLAKFEAAVRELGSCTGTVEELRRACARQLTRLKLTDQLPRWPGAWSILADQLPGMVVPLAARGIVLRIEDDRVTVEVLPDSAPPPELSTGR